MMFNPNKRQSECVSERERVKEKERECVFESICGVCMCVKAMRKLENSVILCSVEINLNGITTVGNLTEINWTSETRKFRGNLTEILTEMFNGNV